MKEILDVEPDFAKINDMDLIGLLSYCEDWIPEKVYDTAYTQVFPKKQIKEIKKPFDIWLEGPRTLPDIVRYELVRAAYVNCAAGKMRNLKFAYVAKEFLKKSVFWIFMMFVLWWWL